MTPEGDDYSDPDINTHGLESYSDGETPYLEGETPYLESEDEKKSITDASTQARDDDLRRRHYLSTIPQTQPYTVRPHTWQHIPGQRPKRVLEPATWTADRATRPLLLTFDAFGTLFHPSPPIEHQYSAIARTYGITLPPASILTSFKAAFKSLSASHPNYGRDSNTPFTNWWYHLIRNTLAPLLPQDTPVPPFLLRDLYARFATSSGYHLYPDVHPFLTLLSRAYSPGVWPPKRTILGLVSNSDPRVRSILHSFGIPIHPAMFPPRYAPHSIRRHHQHNFGPAHFGFATLSYEAGYAKPERGIYSSAVRDAQASLERLSYRARTTRTGLRMLGDVRGEFHCMHVGDELEKDVLPAIRCGWDGVLLDRGATEEVSERRVEVENWEDGYEHWNAEDWHDTAQKRVVRVPVVNNLLALQQLVTRERFEDAEGRPRQKPVWYDEGMKTSDVKPKRPETGPLRKNRRWWLGRRSVLHPMSSTENPLYMLQ